MMSRTTSPFADASSYTPAETLSYRAAVLPAHFGERIVEYQAAQTAATLFDRSDRGLVRVTGNDRKTWLHNLVTNAVKTLGDFDGVYAFAADVKGRTQFDLNILSLPDSFLLDLDRLLTPDALKHLDMRLITEDVQLTDVSADFARLAVVGPAAPQAAAQLGIENFAAFPDLQSKAIDQDTWLFRQDVGKLPGFEVIMPLPHAADRWQELAEGEGITPAGMETLDLVRIEAGVPWIGRDIDATVIPPETGQIERGISYHKGCYLGQEVIERMRSRGIVARRLVQLVGSAGPVETPTELLLDDKPIGKLTSYRQHPVDGHWLGLGYAKSAATIGNRLATDGGVALEITDECR
jgi:folate-binding protein YgfZ